MSSKKTGLKRIKTDVFYTHPDIAELCIKELLQVININVYSVIIEPSAGTGSFSNYFHEHKYNLQAYDINPQASYIQKADFFTVKLDQFQGLILFIGNPPFGRQSSLAKKFISHCASIGQTIAFILPKSFKKESQQKCFPKTFHLIRQMDIPSNAFLIENKSHDVPCVFQIWDRKDSPRLISPKLDPVGFEYVNSDNNPDFSIRRVGFYAGTISEDSQKSKESHYFIRLNDNYKSNSQWKQIFIGKFRQHEFTHNNTVGPKSISKQEFTGVINSILIKP